MTQTAQFLKSAREKAGLSQKQVSDHFGWKSAQFVSNHERSVSMPPVKILRKLAALYRVNPDELFKVFLATTLDEVTKDLKRKFYGKKK